LLKCIRCRLGLRGHVVCILIWFPPVCLSIWFDVFWAFEGGHQIEVCNVHFHEACSVCWYHAVET
jgi:hypothetical protein